MEVLNTCHQCRQRTKNLVASCKNLKKGKLCPLKFCFRCLRNRYEVNAEQVEKQNDWTCPKCRGICNCSCCRKKKGLHPTGKGFSSTSENPEVMGPEIPDTTGAENLGTNDDAIIEKKMIVFDSSSENGVPSNAISPEKPVASEKELDVNQQENILVEKDENIPLPLGTPLKSILNIDLAPKDIGKALQFLEFCKVFGEVLDVKEGEAEAMLEELVCKEKLRRGESMLASRFQIRVLTLILQDSGNRSPTLSITEEKNSWFKALVNLISGSDLVVKELQLGCLKEGIDKYSDLCFSQRLSLLNFLCDEALGTKKLRSFIDEQNLKFVENGKQAKAKVAEATEKEQSLKQKFQDEIAKAITSENNATLSTSEHDALLSEIRSEVAKAHDETLEAMSMVPKRNQRSDALRAEPVFSDGCGQRLWRLKCYTTEYAFLMQDSKIEEGQEAIDERWFVYGADKKEEMEKYIASRSKRPNNQNDSRTFKTNSCEANM